MVKVCTRLTWDNVSVPHKHAQLRLQALLLYADKPANYAWQVETLRGKLEVLEWQISCAVNDRLYAQRRVVDTCVDNALSDFMANSGKALTSALAPYLNGSFGLDVTLRSALAHHAELSVPELLESCRDILDESGLSPDASMRMDASRRFTPAKHKTFQGRLNRLKLTEEAYGFTVSRVWRNLTCPFQLL